MLNARRPFCLMVALAVSCVAIADEGTPKKSDAPVKDTSITAKAEVGKPAPEFALKDIDGKEHKLSDYKGRIIILQWTNHECPYVQRFEKVQMKPHKVHAKFLGYGVVWLAIDSSHFCEKKIEAVRKFRDEAKLPHPVLLDASGAVGRLYGAKISPQVFVIDRAGKIVYIGAPDNEATREEDEPRRFYIDEVLDALVFGKDLSVSETKPYGCNVKYGP